MTPGGRIFKPVNGRSAADGPGRDHGGARLSRVERDRAARNLRDIGLVSS